MYSPLRLIALTLCLAGILVGLPALASAHGSSGPAVTDGVQGAGYNEGPETGSAVSGMTERGDSGGGVTGGGVGTDNGIGGSGATSAGGFSEQGSEGSPTTVFSDTGRNSAGDENLAVLSAGQVLSSQEDTAGGEEFGGKRSPEGGSGTGSSPDRSFPGESQGDLQRSFQGPVAASDGRLNPGPDPIGPGPVNQQESPGKGDNTGILAYSGNLQDPVRQREAPGASPGSPLYGKAGEQQGNVKISAGPFQGMVLFGTAGGTILGMEGRTFSAESKPPSDFRGPGGSFPERRENPWGDSTHRQLPPETTGIEPEAKNPVSRPKGKKDEDLLNPSESDEIELRPTPGLPSGVLSFLLFPLFGYRRIHKKNVLQNEGRGRIFQVIYEHPGIDVVTLSDAVGMNINTVRYHLVKLTATGKITYLSRPGILRYYPNQGSYSVFEQLIIHYLRNPSTSTIIALLERQPGITRQDLADSLGISGPSVTRHMQQLIEDRIVTNTPEGVTNHYQLSPESAAMLGGLLEKLRALSTAFLAVCQEPRISSS